MSSVPPSPPAPGPAPEERPMSFAEATLWTIGSVVAVVSLYQNGTRFFPAIAHDPGASSLLQLISYSLLLLLLKTFYFPKTETKVIFALRPGSWVFFPIAALLGAAILFPASALYEAALARWPETEAQGTEILSGFWTMPLWRKVLAGAGLCVVTPFMEELLFRGALFGTLRRRHSAPLVVLMTASLFAMVHLQTQLLLPISLVGAALAFLRVASGSMWPGVLLHIAFNSLSFYAQVTQGPDGGDEKTPTWQILAGTVVTAGLLALVEHLRTRKVYTLPDIEHPAEPREEER